MFFLPEKKASRKFIDLIHRATTLWANWQPSIPVEIGSFGTVDEETGEFQQEGNIFKEPEIAHIVSKYSPVTGPPVNIYVLRSMDAKRAEITPDSHANAFGVAEPVFSGQFKFGRTRGAFLLLHDSRVTRFPNELLEELKKIEWSQGKCIVTEVHSCPAYALYLSEKKSETVSISLRADIPVAAGVAAGGGIKAGWISSGASGTFQQACTDKPLYVPLFQIKTITKIKGARDTLPENFVERDEWMSVKVPWTCLDEDGDELPSASDEEDSDLDMSVILADSQ